jgi:hypothetical protein
MTKKLEELFNLDEEKPKTEVTKVEDDAPTKDEVRSLERSYTEVNTIAGSLPKIDELDSLNDNELDNLAQKAENAYDELMDLGMNVEVRYSGRIFEVAGSMLKNAIDAKATKIDKKLKAVDLKLKKLKIDQDRNPDAEDIMNGQGFVVTDRNELLRKLRGEE